MAIVCLWYLLYCMYLTISQWSCNADGERSLSKDGCLLVSKMADCRHLQLQSIPQDLPSITQELLLDFNRIESLSKHSLQRYRDLTNLSLKSNYLGQSLLQQDNTISITYTELKWLDLSRNNLNGDMVSALLKNVTTLEYLYLDYNVIMRLDGSVFEGLNSLIELSLQGNYIYEIEVGTFEHMKRLKTLNLAFNLLPCIEDFGLTQLQMLNLSFNHIEWFLSRESDDDFQLEKLDISHNQLFYFPLLPKRHHIQTLLLSENRMRFFTNSSFVDFLILQGNISSVITVDIWEESIPSDLSSLQILDISRNQFEYLPLGFLSNMTSLSHLKLDWNCLTSFDMSHGHISNALNTLDLSNNDLSELRINTRLQSFPQLLYFNLSQNKLQELPREIFNTMISLDTLDLSNNFIRLCCRTTDKGCLDLKNTPSIRHLGLSNCGLNLDCQSVFQGTQLTHLDISDNPLKSLHFLKDTAGTLKLLSIRNSLSLVDGLDFSDFLCLVSLDLSENSLTTFPISLTYLTLQYLDVRKNRLTSLPLTDSNKPLIRELNTVFLSKNPFDCCKLNWFNILMASNRINVPDLRDMTCNFSNTYRSVPELLESHISGCEWKSGGNLLSMVLTVPTLLTLLVALLILFLTFKQPLLKLFKKCFRTSTSY
ncbi:transforming growth factor beta activator LRRC33 [Hyperolius riggenbachi]|uniref:transforming growth factor beta activator LRRC33 n=1 Tax=Hyperolius riggenbachi TaxID=752182 RepID=UPI0035A2F630